MKRILLFILAVVMALSLVSCRSKTKTFSKDGFEVTLPSSFINITMLNQDVVAAFMDLKGDIVVTATKNTFEEVGDSDMTAEDYAWLIIRANKFESFITEEDGVPTFRYSKMVEEERYIYIAYAYVASDAYWLVSFACPADKLSELEDAMIEYAKTVKVN